MMPSLGDDEKWIGGVTSSSVSYSCTSSASGSESGSLETDEDGECSRLCLWSVDKLGKCAIHAAHRAQ